MHSTDDPTPEDLEIDGMLQSVRESLGDAVSSRLRSGPASWPADETDIAVEQMLNSMHSTLQQAVRERAENQTAEPVRCLDLNAVSEWENEDGAPDTAPWLWPAVERLRRRATIAYWKWKQGMSHDGGIWTLDKLEATHETLQELLPLFAQLSRIVYGQAVYNIQIYQDARKYTEALARSSLRYATRPDVRRSEPKDSSGRRLSTWAIFHRISLASDELWRRLQRSDLEWAPDERARVKWAWFMEPAIKEMKESVDEGLCLTTKYVRDLGTVLQLLREADTDFCGAHLEDVDLRTVDLYGIRWDHSTTWPPGWQDNIRAVSWPIGDGSFVILGRPEDAPMHVDV
ncbi:hypothetical protein ACFC7A_19540 [Streptomyces niveus]|uniref:hypothetical protein n=1 Tax=Streptomyces niveus TaxID=193462 RepID=UPI0035DF1204